MVLAVVVGVAGATGAAVRYLADGIVQDRTSGPFPLGALVVNLVGSLLFGIIAGVALAHAGASTARVIIGTGFCGGMTTWSTVSWETVRLVEEGLVPTALRHAFANLAGSLAAGGLGLLLTLRYV